MKDGVVQYIGDSYDEELSSVIRVTENIPEELNNYRFDVNIINGGEDDNIVIGLSSKIRYPRSIGKEIGWDDFTSH